MQINQIAGQQQNIGNKQKPSFNGGREIIRTLMNPDALASTIVLETFVTGGRSVRAYKRSGFPELRERLFDDVVSAVFWMKGVDIFNGMGNKFGEHVLKLPTTEFDVGKDALRNPFGNLIADLGESTTDSNALKKLEMKLASFKFSKIILSTILAVGFVGFALPKINQAITKYMLGGKKDNQDENKSNNSYNTQLLQSYSFESFEKNINNKEKPSFKGIISPQTITTAAHYLENNKICKLLSSDVGIASGRVITARDIDEGIEFGFRDVTSSFFYYASTPIIYKLLQKISNSGNMTTIDPVAAKQIHNKLVEQLKNADGSFASMEVKEFAAKTIGSLDDKAIELLGKLPFKSDVISLNELKKFITDENLIKKATEMAKLQPAQAGVGQVLTKQQVQDVLKNGSLNTPEFMQSIFKDKFGENLTNPYRFIPMKKITSFRSNIDKYVQSVLDYAQKNNSSVIDKEILDKINKKSFVMSSAFRITAIAFSAFFLGYVIPKVQCMITEKRTGSKTAPGLKEYHLEKNEKYVKKS